MTATIETIETTETTEAYEAAELDELREMLADPATLTTERLEHQMVSQAGHLSAAMCRWLLLVAEYDRRKAYEAWECRSMGAFLEWKCQLAANTAREYVRVGRAVAALPVVRASFQRGELSYSKVRAITRVATPDTEAELVDLAREMTGSQLDRTMRTVEKAARQITVGDAWDQYSKRSLDRFADEHDMPYWVLRPSPEEDEMLQRAVEMVRDQDYVAARAEAKEIAAADGKARYEIAGSRGSKLPRIDALMRVIELGMTRPAEFGDDEMPSERYQITIHQHGPARIDADGMVLLQSGVRLHPRTAQRLGCNATIRLVDDSGSELNMGRRLRAFTRRQKRALAGRYPRCGFPNCDIPVRWCDAHHFVHWTNGGPTDIDNGIPLCKRHHHAVHEGGWRLFTDAAGMVIAIGPDGRRVTRSCTTEPPPPGFLLPELHDRLGLSIRPAMDPPYERGDLRYVIDTLIANFEYAYLRQKQQIEEAAAAIPGGTPGTGKQQQPLLN